MSTSLQMSPCLHHSKCHHVYVTPNVTMSTSLQMSPCLRHSKCHHVYITPNVTMSTSLQMSPCLHRSKCHHVYITPNVTISTSLQMSPCLRHSKCHHVYITPNVTMSTSLQMSPCLHHSKCHHVYITPNVTMSTSLQMSPCLHRSIIPHVVQRRCSPVKTIGCLVYYTPSLVPRLISFWCFFVPQEKKGGALVVVQVQSHEITLQWSGFEWRGVQPHDLGYHDQCHISWTAQRTHAGIKAAIPGISE